MNACVRVLNICKYTYLDCKYDYWWFVSAKKQTCFFSPCKYTQWDQVSNRPFSSDIFLKTQIQKYIKTQISKYTNVRKYTQWAYLILVTTAATGGGGKFFSSEGNFLTVNAKSTHKRSSSTPVKCVILHTVFNFTHSV